jgi:thiol-disulfide isomerase/thioredoxin
MRNIFPLLVLFGLITLISCNDNKNRHHAELFFDFIAANEDTLKVYQIDPLTMVRRNEQELILDSTGKGKVIYESTNPVFVEIEIDGINFPSSLLIEKGTSILIKGKKEDLLNTVHISGNGAIANNYKIGLEKVVNKFAHMDNLYFFQLDSTAFFHRITNMENEINLYNTQYFSTHSLPTEVKNLLLTESELKSKFYLSNYYLVNQELSKKESITIPWDSSLLEYGSGFYRMVLDFYLDLEIVNPIWNIFQAKSSSIEEKQIPLLVLNKIQEANIPKAFKDFFIAQYIYIHHIRNYNITAEFNNLFLRYQELYPNSNYITILEKEYEKTKYLETGSIAPEIKGITIAGDTIHLSDFRGKVVYIDVWATWCPPCITEFQAMLQLEKELGNNEDLLFLYISIDEDMDKWNKFIKTQNFGGLQINSSRSTLQKDYLVASIPRYFIIDKQGKIVNANASKPSSEKIKEEILMVVRGSN